MAYFAISVDALDANTKFAKKLDLDFPILSDPDKKTATQYGVLSTRGFANRWTYYIDSSGVIRHIDKAVKAADHGTAVAKKLEELGVKKKS